MKENNFFDQFNTEILRNLTKSSNKGYILYDISYSNYKYDLSVFDLYDILRDKNPKLLYQKLYEESSGESIDINKISDFYAKKELIERSEIYYADFKNLINLYKIMVDKIDYKPINERIYFENGLYILNLFQFRNEYKDSKPDKNAKFPHIKKIIKNIAGNQIKYDFFIDLLAYKIQNPLDLVPTHLIIQDDGGTGKSDLLLGDILENIFNINIATQDDLDAGFNSFMRGSQFVWCEEVEGFEDEKKLKALTGAKWINLNEKYEKNVKIRNYNTFIVASNELRVMKITENDRRWSVIGGGLRLVPLAGKSWDETLFKSKEDNEEFFAGYHKNLKSELKQFYNYLLSVEITRSKIQIPLDNDSKSELINMNKTSEHIFIDDIIEFGFSQTIHENIMINADQFEKDFIFYKHSIDEEIEGNYIKINDLYKLYVKFCESNEYRKKLTKRIFIKRLSTYKPFIEIFDHIKVIRINENTYRCIRLKTNKNLTNSIDKIEQIEIDNIIDNLTI